MRLDPVAGAARERVVCVVPRLAHREQREAGARCELWSCDRNGCVPKRWHTELIIHVTLWVKPIRRMPAQTSAPTAPASVP